LAVRPIGAQLSRRAAAPTFGVSLVCAEAGIAIAEDVNSRSASGNFVIDLAHKIQVPGIEPDHASEVHQQACHDCRIFSPIWHLTKKFARRFVMQGGVRFISGGPYLQVRRFLIRAPLLRPADRAQNIRENTI